MIKTKLRKITSRQSHKKYVPGIDIKGQIVKDTGFDYGTPVLVTIQNNLITIEKQ